MPTPVQWRRWRIGRGKQGCQSQPKLKRVFPWSFKLFCLSVDFLHTRGLVDIDLDQLGFAMNPGRRAGQLESSVTSSATAWRLVELLLLWRDRILEGVTLEGCPSTRHDVHTLWKQGTPWETLALHHGMWSCWHFSAKQRCSDALVSWNDCLEALWWLKTWPKTSSHKLEWCS